MAIKIKEICQKLKIKPLKRRGQNFLINSKILDLLIKAAELKKDDFILEIGPGFGILTEKLAEKVKKILAIEIDKKLADFLKEKFKNKKNVEIIQDDILKIKNSKLKIQNSYKIVANIPYNITGAVLRKFLTEKPKPSLMVLMLQKEVAERIIVKNKKNSIISLMVNFYGQPEIVSFVSKKNFWPRPKVNSAILKIKIKKKTFFNDWGKEKKFFQFLHQGFSRPRKQLINNLSQKEKLKKILEKIGLDFKIRAEDLTLNHWLKIYKLYEG